MRRLRKGNKQIFVNKIKILPKTKPLNKQQTFNERFVLYSFILRGVNLNRPFLRLGAFLNLQTQNTVFE